MSKCHLWMMIACVAILGSLLVLPSFGVELKGVSFLLPLAMMACCILPMFGLLGSRSGEKKGGCCNPDQTAKPTTTGTGETKSGSCH